MFSTSNWAAVLREFERKMRSDFEILWNRAIFYAVSCRITCSILWQVEECASPIRAVISQPVPYLSNKICAQWS